MGDAPYLWAQTGGNLIPRPRPQGGKGLVYIEQFLGHTGCSMSCDWHDNASFWHGNASTTLTRVLRTARGRCHMIITYKPHGMNLIGATEFRNATSSSPGNHSMYTRPFPSLRVGSGNETNWGVGQNSSHQHCVLVSTQSGANSM